MNFATVFRAKKISLDKSKVVSLSRLKPSQWKELISAFENLGLGKNTPKQRAKDTGDENVTEIGRIYFFKRRFSIRALK